MATAYTSLLGLALPVTGELSGTWGDTVNTAITGLLDTAVAGTTSITVDADTTLTTTTGAANTSRQAIILWNPAAGTTTRNITAPAQSKMYTVINASGGTQSIVLRGAGPTTGVTILKGESAIVAWNGSDFVKVSTVGGAGTFTNLTVTGNTILGDAIGDTLTVNATTSFTAPVNLPSTGRSAAAALTPTNPAFLYGVASTYTDTTSSGTLAPVASFYGLAQPTLSTSNVTTYTTAATLYIANAPTTGGSATITNPYSLYVAAGAVNLGGNTAVTGTLSATGNATLASGTATTSGATIGSPSQAIDGGSYLRLQNSNSTTNWQISANLIGGGVLDFTPSTTGGGTTFTTPRMALSSTGLAVTGALSATTNITLGTDTSYNLNIKSAATAATNAIANIIAGNAGLSALFLSDTDLNAVGRFQYQHSDNTLHVFVNSLDRFIFADTGLAVTGTLSATGTTSIGSGTALGTVPLDVHTLTGACEVGIYANSNASATAHAQLRLYSGGTSGGDPIVNWEVTGGSRYYMGIDNSNSDKLVIGSGYNPGASDYLTIDATGLAVTGALSATGIISSPSSIRVVPTTGTNSALFYSTNTGGTSFFGMDNSAGGGWSAGAYALGVWQGGAYPIAFGTNGTLRMTLDSSGNLGIGTSSPGSRVDARLAASGSGAVVTVGNVNNGPFGGFGITDGAPYPLEVWGNVIVFKTNGASYASTTEKMRLDTSGYLGIGETVPVSRIHVSGTGFGATTTIRIDSTSTSNSAPPSLILTRSSSAVMSAQGIGNIYFTRLLTDASSNTAASIVATGNNSSSAPTCTLNYDALTTQVWKINGTQAASITSTGLAVTGTIQPTTDLVLSTGQLTSNSGSNPLLFGINNVEKMRLGTTGTLTLAKSQGVIQSGADGYLALSGGSSVALGAAIIAFGESHATAPNEMHFRNSGNTTRMTLDASGNLLVGKTASALATAGVELQGVGFLSVTRAERPFVLNRLTTDGDLIELYRDSVSKATIGITTNNLTFGVGGAEKMRLTSVGDLLVGTTSAGLSGVTIYNAAANSNVGRVDIAKSASGAATAMTFRYVATAVGSISYTDVATSFNTSSDYRLKDNIAPMAGALAKVAALKPVTYQWKLDGSAGEGFIAHELAEVCPDAVTGEKDAVDADGTPQYQGIDTSFLVATLTAAIQEQQALIASLTARLDAANL